ncbi:hypothetical protein AC1031_008369 [Aphanomyces cochlioides]|nr:hypothetical protein AC1031_008369 [Aphanomyces cochlioides]
MIGLTSVLTHHHIPPKPLTAEETRLTGARIFYHDATSRRLLFATACFVAMLLSIGVTTTQSWQMTSLPVAQLDAVRPPFACDTTEQASGYIKLPNKLDAHYFYWFFESRDKPETDPLVLWLTSGPGGSSMMALLTENGPCSVASDGETTISNPYSWTSNANVIWVDQPVGVGFSYGQLPEDYDHTLDDVANNMYLFLQGWLKEHPSFARRPFFITGESFAGQHGPAIAAKLLTRQPADDEIAIPLQGVAVGNGWTSPLIQIQHQTDLIYENTYGKTIFEDTEALATYERSTQAIAVLADACNSGHNATACVEASLQWKKELMVPLVSTAAVDRFDLRKPSATVSLEEGSAARSAEMSADIGNAATTSFLNDETVQQQLHVASDRAGTWRVIASDVNENFSQAMFENADHYVATVLAHNVPVLMYAGDADLMCNWKGIEAWMLALPWPGRDAFNSAAGVPFIVEGTTAGELRTAGPLSFLRLFKSGHMVPMDQPVVALAMLNRIIHQEPLTSHE